MRDCKKRHMFDIWIMFWRIRDDVMYVMTSFPPPQAKASKEISDHNADDCVNCEIMSDTHVPCIMGSKNKLVPEKAKEKAACSVPTPL